MYRVTPGTCDLHHIPYYIEQFWDSINLILVYPLQYSTPILMARENEEERQAEFSRKVRNSGVVILKLM